MVVKALAISLMPIGIMVHRSYSESLIDVNFLALIYPLAFIIFVLPGSYFVHKYGLRSSVILGIVLTTIGSIMKVFIDHAYEWVVFG